MKLILAQGNPGFQYATTRHNIGWQVLDAFAVSQRLGEFEPKTKFLASILEYRVNDEKIVLAKPTTFYNETGRSAHAIADFYRISTENILVIHDDLALSLGTLRVRQGGSDAGNNGIKSLNAHLGSDFWRLRIGVKNDLLEHMDSAHFVLGQIADDEKNVFKSLVIPAALPYIEQFITGQLTATSTSLTANSATS